MTFIIRNKGETIMKTIILNGFNKKTWTTQELVDILADCSIKSAIDEKFIFEGSHHYLKGAKKTKKKRK